MKFVKDFLAAFRRPEPTPAQMAAVHAFLRLLVANGGFLAEGDEGPDLAASSLALRLRYADIGNGWSAGTSITPKGRQALAAAHLLDGATHGS